MNVDAVRKTAEDALNAIVDACLAESAKPGAPKACSAEQLPTVNVTLSVQKSLVDCSTEQDEVPLNRSNGVTISLILDVKHPAAKETV